MICVPCAECADAGIQGKEAHEAAGCIGCDCQHRDGPRENWVQTKPVFPVG